MIFEVEDDTRDFKTTYKKDYAVKCLRKCFKAQPFFTEIIESNPIIDEFKEHLHTDKQNERLPLRKRSESLRDYLNKIRNERTHLKKILPEEPPNEAVIEREKKNLLRSIYQFGYANNLDYRTPLEQKEPDPIILPENYSVPETMQKKSFRDPRYFGTIDALQAKQLKPPNNLTVNETERKILRVRTGNSEYQEFIGRTGQKIIKEQFFDPLLPIYRPEEHIKGPDSAKSECSLILLNSRNHVLSQII